MTPCSVFRQMATSGSITAPQDSGCLLIFLVAVPSYPLTISGAFLGASLGQGNGRRECRGERGRLAARELVSAPPDSGWNSREALAIVSLAKFAVPPTSVLWLVMYSHQVIHFTRGKVLSPENPGNMKQG